jgi:transposase-like protein
MDLSFHPDIRIMLNAVENFFSALTRRALRRGVFKSVPDLQKTIRDHIKRQNAEPRTFVWTKSANDIFAKLDELPVQSV